MLVLKSKDRIIQSLLQTQNMLTNSLSILKAKQPEPIINLSEQQQRQHEKYRHQYHLQQHRKHQQQRSQQQQPSQQSQKIQSSRQQKQQGLGNQKQIILGKNELDTLYVGNLSEVKVNESESN